MNDNGCVWCAIPLRTRVRCGDSQTTEHLIPWSQGGVDVWPNITLSCRTCNLTRGAKPVPPWMTSETIVLMDKSWAGALAEFMYAALQHHKGLGREINPEWSRTYLDWAFILMRHAIIKDGPPPLTFYGMVQMLQARPDGTYNDRQIMEQAFPYTAEWDRLDIAQCEAHLASQSDSV